MTSDKRILESHNGWGTRWKEQVDPKEIYPVQWLFISINRARKNTQARLSVTPDQCCKVNSDSALAKLHNKFLNL